MIRYFTTGAHAHRMPLSYPALAPLVAPFATRVERPEEADLHVYAHVLDVMQAPAAAVQDWRARRRPVVILSEEPFWDTLWGRRPLARHRVVDTAHGALPVVQLNHHTSRIFDFDRIPYYLLTNPRFAAAYGARFARNARVTAAEWRARFAARPRQAAFMFERRPGAFHDLRWPEGDIIGLCAWRTTLAEACTGRVDRLGQSWGRGPSRFALDNWHLDKLVQLDGRARMIGAIENTHQPAYLTEKLFDAFACGAVPLYFASPRHRVHGLGLPAGAWINLYGLSPRAAAERVAQGVDPATHEAYAAAQRHLAVLLGEARIWVRERARLAHALQEALTEVAETEAP